MNMIINKTLIEAVKYYKIQNYPFVTHYKRGHVKKYFFGLFKKELKKDEYAEYTIGKGYETIEDIEKWLKEHKNLYVDYFGDICYKPRIVITMQSGEKYTQFFETREEAERELEYIKNGREKFIELEEL